jgi:hypothetical protein
VWHAKAATEVNAPDGTASSAPATSWTQQRPSLGSPRRPTRPHRPYLTYPYSVSLLRVVGVFGWCSQLRSAKELTPIFQEIAGGGLPLFVSADQLTAA